MMNPSMANNASNFVALAAKAVAGSSADELMAFDAQRDQVFEAVIPELAARLDVMNLQVLDCAAILTASSIPPENLPAKILVRLGC